MKRIIFNHIKRWSLLWIAIGIFYFFTFFNSLTLVNEGKSTDLIHYINFPLLLWLSAFALNFESQRGSGRVQMTLPVSARQIGRAWWFLSVALPTVFLAAIAGVAMLIHSLCKAGGLTMDALVVPVIFIALYFGSLFYLLLSSPLGQPQNAIAWVRTVLMVGFFFGIIFIKPTFNTPQGIVFLVTAAILTVAGWFRAEHMVRERSGFRQGVVTGKKKPGRYQATTGLGGLPFLCQTLFIRLAYMGLAVVAWMLVMQIFMHGFGRLSPQQRLEAMLPAFSSFGYFFIFQFLLMPMVAQLRQLRTLPIPVSSLAAILVLLPIVPIIGVGAGWTAVSGNMQLSFLMFAAMMAIAVPFFVWRGMRMGTFLVLVFLVMVTGIGRLKFLSLKVPAPLTVLVALGIIALAFEITRRLLQSSSQAYRPATASTGGWGGGNVWGGGR